MDESSLRRELAAAISSGAKELDWSNRGLRSLPSGIGGLIHLEKWNLAGNLLEDLPDELSQLGSLRTLFFLNNRFTRIPPVVGRLPNLFMLSFKSNRLEAIAEDALPPSLGWLILTDNRLAALPAALGRLPRLRKLMLASNQLTSLPDIGDLAALELVRLSDNRLHEVPAGLLALPRLAWVALAGNRFPPLPRDAVAAALAAAPPGLQAKDLKMGEKLGEGASGTVFAATDADGGAVAVKVFKAASSDGRPEDEVVAAARLPPHPSLINMRGFTAEGGAAGGFSKLIAVLELCTGMTTLGKPPSFSSVTRDVYPAGSVPALTLPQAAAIARAVASAGAHLHAHGVAHGDVYAHNVMVDMSLLGAGEPAGALRALLGGRVKLGDFGAAFVYDPAGALAPAVQLVEVRAWACLCSELAALAMAGGENEAALREGVRALASPCEGGLGGVTTFSAAVAQLDALLAPFL